MHGSKFKCFLMLILSVYMILSFHYQLPASATISDNNEVQFTKEEKTRLNTFFSNFSETFVPPFDMGQISNKELIRFGVFHNYINNRQRFERIYEFSEERLAAEYVEGTVYWYFGKKVQHQTYNLDLRYNKGYYYIPMAAGEGLHFSQITKLINLGGNYYTAYVDIYSEGFEQVSGAEGMKYLYKPLEDWEPQYRNKIELCQKMKAIIKKVTENGNARYILIQYLVAK